MNNGMNITLRSGKHVNNIKATSMYKVIQSDHVALKHNLVRYIKHITIASCFMQLALGLIK